MRWYYLNAAFKKEDPLARVLVHVETRQSLHDWNTGKANATISRILISFWNGDAGYFIRAIDWHAFEDILIKIEPTPHVSLDFGSSLRSDPAIVLLLVEQGFLPRLVADNKVLLRLENWTLFTPDVLARNTVAYEVDDVLVDSETMALFSEGCSGGKTLFYLRHPFKVPPEVDRKANELRRRLGLCKLVDLPASNQGEDEACIVTP